MLTFLEGICLVTTGVNVTVFQKKGHQPLNGLKKKRESFGVAQSKTVT